MILDRSQPTLCFVHDAQEDEIPQALESASDPVWQLVDLVQIRAKTLSTGELERLSRRWVARLDGLSTRVIINDRMDVALATGADGAHLGQDDLPLSVARGIAPEGFLIGVSTHNDIEIQAAAAEGADYTGLGCFFTTSTKDDVRALDRASIGSTGTNGLPVLAIGGVTRERVADALALPVVSGIAVSSAVQGEPDPGAAITTLREELNRAWEQRGGDSR